MGEADAAVPAEWPKELGTGINLEHPANISDARHSYGAFITVSTTSVDTTKRNSQTL